VEDKFHPTISALPSWIPQVDQSNSVPPKTAFAQSEYVYEPHLLNAVVNITGIITKALTVNAPSVHWTVYPQTAAFFEEFGEKYIFEHKYAQHGGTGTRDNNYYFYNPALVPTYGTLNFTIAVGLRHDSLSWTKLGKASPHALFWNFVYSDSTEVGALTSFNNHDATVQSYVTLPTLGGSLVNDPLGVIWVRPIGVTSTTSPVIKAVLNGLGLLPTTDENLKGVNPLTVIHHTYVNPDTGVAPWLGSIVTPLQIHITGAV